MRGLVEERRESRMHPGFHRGGTIPGASAKHPAVFLEKIDSSWDSFAPFFFGTRTLLVGLRRRRRKQPRPPGSWRIACDEEPAGTFCKTVARNVFFECHRWNSLSLARGSRANFLNDSYKRKIQTSFDFSLQDATIPLEEEKPPDDFLRLPRGQGCLWTFLQVEVAAIGHLESSREKGGSWRIFGISCEEVRVQVQDGGKERLLRVPSFKSTIIGTRLQGEFSERLV
ncbi:uncharacterized protein LOC105704368 [Orussus abietinus]|uniref:uncharacterized protein LOC105704368 n=1 Tax=Orussus abietinus TaxID=222816 RepID=UPI0006264866|nr:uncharacterized protein LOC105704368 [Orussus abietinus]